MSVMSEQDMFLRLRCPFTNEAIKWKIQTNPKDGESFALCVAYVDARDVAARLNEVVGINWESNFSDLIFFSDEKKGEVGVRCYLTVLGHTRTDIGTLPTTEPLKGGYSDALKRAAVQFGIAAYVYAFPVVKAEVQKFGRSYYFTPNAKKELSQLVQSIHAGADRLPKFHAIQVRGYVPILFDSPYFGNEVEGDDVDTHAAFCEAEGCGVLIVDYINEQGKALRAAKIVEGTRAKYGRALCWNCAQKAKRAEEKAEEREPHVAPSDTPEAARKRYEEACNLARQLELVTGKSADYRNWNSSQLNAATEALHDAIKNSISSTALEDDGFLAENNEDGLPDDDAPLSEWMAFAAAWELIQTIRAENLNMTFELDAKEEVAR